jgi:UDP-N-acetylglucosamine 2-epimerase (non-hydrolysing)
MMKLLIVFGTRPEGIKLAPLIKECERRRISLKVCVTGQHREMLDPFLKFWQIRVDYDLAIMKPGQDLYHVTSAVLLGLRDILRAEKPDAVIVQGDTTTAFATALAAFYEKIPLSHVEAGLRTANIHNPFPEEMNRRLTDHLSEWLFAPTEQARQNLLAEGIPSDKITVTGNTIVDAINSILKDERFQKMEAPLVVNHGRRMILVTAHRRESFGEQFEALCRALRQIAEANTDVEIVYPVHLNPNVQEPVYRILGGLDRVHLIEPLGYLAFLKMMEQAALILTDSGGVQEEAPSLGKPVLVMRNVTERGEGVELGFAKLVGTSTKVIVRNTQLMLDSPVSPALSAVRNPYGDGQASERIVTTLVNSSSSTLKAYA